MYLHPGRVAQLASVVLMRQGSGFDVRSGHAQEANNECVSGMQTEVSFSVSLFFLLSNRSIKNIFPRDKIFSMLYSVY